MGSKHSSPSPFGSILKSFSDFVFIGDLDFEGEGLSEGFSGDLSGDFWGELEGLAAGVLSKELLGVAFVRFEAVSVVSVGPRAGESAARVEFMLVSFPKGFLGLTLLANDRRGVPPLVESKLPCEMSCRHDMILSLGGCVDVLSLLVLPVACDIILLGLPVACDIILLGLPIFEPVRLENTDELSQLSLARARFWNAQSCRNTLSAPV
jgi:hypothetical protein